MTKRGKDTKSLRIPLRENRKGCIPDCRFLSESGFSEFKDSQDSAGGKHQTNMNITAGRIL
jgi:hypothetical protein